jgi:hypothetical protein
MTPRMQHRQVQQEHAGGPTNGSQVRLGQASGAFVGCGWETGHADCCCDVWTIEHSEPLSSS